MRRYWIEKKDVQQNQVIFANDTFHHIFDVCRQTLGSTFEVLTEDGKAYLVEVTDIAKKNATAKVLEKRTIEALKRPHIHLALSLSRFPVMDAVVEKAVEIGVKSIHPFYSDYSFLRKNESLSQSKVERWNKIIKSATQQSARGDLMSIETCDTFEKILEKFNQQSATLGLFAYEGQSVMDMQTFVQTASATQASIQDIWIFVGSEGGFSSKEVEVLNKAGLKPVTLGKQVLRVETACVTLVAVIKYAFNLWK